MINRALYPAKWQAAQRLAANPTGSREGHAAGGILGGGRFAHPVARSAAQRHYRPSTSQQVPQGRAGSCWPHYRRTPAALQASRVLQAYARRVGLRCFYFTEEERKALSFAAFCEAESISQTEESDHPEVKAAIHALNRCRRILGDWGQS